MRVENRLVRDIWNRASRVETLGFEIRFFEPSDVVPLRFKLERALHILQDYDPHTFEQIRIAMPRLLIAELPRALARYYPEQEICQIRAQYVRHGSTSPARIAMTLVHEGMHARVHARRLSHKGLTRMREERLAASSELAFAERLPGADDLVDYARKRLEGVDTLYSREARLRSSLAAALDAGVPRWLVRWMARRRGVDLSANELLADPYATPVLSDHTRTRRGSSKLQRRLILAAWFVICAGAATLIPSPFSAVAAVLLLVGWGIVARRSHGGSP